MSCLNTSYADSTCEIYELVFHGYIGAALCLVGLVGNSLCFVTLGKEKPQRSVTFLLRSLSVADNVFLFTWFMCIAFWLVLDHMTGGLSASSRSANAYILFSLFPVACTARQVSIWITVTVAAKRYVSVCRNNQQGNQATTNKHKQMTILITITFLASLLYLPIYFQWEIVEEVAPDNSGGDKLVYTDLIYDEVYRILYNTTLRILVTASQFTAAVGLSVALLVFVCKTNRNRSRLFTNTTRNGSSARLSTSGSDEMTVTLCVIIATFVLTEIPSLVYITYRFAVGDDWIYCCGTYDYLYITADTINVLNSAVNFLIYYPCGVTFRKNIRKILCGEILIAKTTPAPDPNMDLQGEEIQPRVMEPQELQFGHKQSRVLESVTDHSGTRLSEPKQSLSGVMQSQAIQDRTSQSGVFNRTATQRMQPKSSVSGNSSQNTARCSSFWNTHCFPFFLKSNTVENRNNNCSNVEDKTNKLKLCGRFLCCSPCCFCGRSKVSPTGIGDYPQASASSMRSRMEASSNYPSCTAVSAIPLKAYSQFNHVDSHPMSQIESVFQGLRKKSVESYAVSPVDMEESMTEVSSTDQLQIEIPIVSQKPFYIL